MRPHRFASPLAATVLLLASGCGSGAQEPEPQESPASSELVGTTLDGEYTARCGCVIDSIGHCGNYVLVEGQPLEIHGDHGLGVMEFCGQPDQTAQVKGTVTEAGVEAEVFEIQG